MRKPTVTLTDLYISMEELARLKADMDVMVTVDDTFFVNNERVVMEALRPSLFTDIPKNYLITPEFKSLCEVIASKHLNGNKVDDLSVSDLYLLATKMIPEVYAEVKKHDDLFWEQWDKENPETKGGE